MQALPDTPTQRSTFTRDAIVTAAVVVLAFLAFDDITTDVDSSFALERLALAGCALWFFAVARQFWRQGKRTLAGISFTVLGLAALAQPFVGRGMTGFEFSYLATIAGLAWFLLVAGLLGLFGWRGIDNRHLA